MMTFVPDLTQTQKSLDAEKIIWITIPGKKKNIVC